MEDRKEHIEQLLTSLKTLEEKVVSVKNDDTLPFSFFKEAFNRMQDIMRQLHNLELMQIDEMKLQMERLVLFLSENEKQPEKEIETIEVEEPEEVCSIVEESPSLHAEPVQSAEEPQKTVFPGNVYAQNVVFPEFKNPRITHHSDTNSDTNEGVEQLQSDTPNDRAGEETCVIQSLNDKIQAPPSVLDLKRGLSLNDRFLFQRELFNNDHLAMNSMMLRLNAFDTYEEAERYLREKTSWNFDNETVTTFLQIIKRGFS